jgi:hypothetical protein
MPPASRTERQLWTGRSLELVVQHEQVSRAETERQSHPNRPARRHADSERASRIRIDSLDATNRPHHEDACDEHRVPNLWFSARSRCCGHQCFNRDPSAKWGAHKTYQGLHAHVIAVATQHAQGREEIVARQVCDIAFR